MKKPLLTFLAALILANTVAGITLYSIYFPWSSDIDYELARNEIRNDLLAINISFSSVDYEYSKNTSDKISYEINREIRLVDPSQLGLEQAQKEQLATDRYLIHMDGKDGAIGIFQLESDNHLVIGPYYSQYEYINLRDIIVYLFLLLFFNGICVWGFDLYLKSRFKTASHSIHRLSNTLELKQYNDTLANVIINTPNLVDTIFELQSKHQKNLRNQQDLMHAVAHEFRGPMARIGFAIDLLLNENKPKDSIQLKSEVESSLEELDALVREVLDYSKLKDGHQILRPESFNIIDIVSSVREKVSLVYPNKSFNVRIEPKQNIECFLDRKMIERAILNLTRNAAKFSFSKVYISISANNDNLEILVEDDGNGVPPGKRERIFEPFTRLDHSRSRDSGGAGLGLAIVRGIANRHNGEISVHNSDVLGGAKFKLILPVKI